MGIREKVKESVGQVRDRSRRLVDLNVEMLKAELREKAAKYGTGMVLFVAAALFAFFGLAFLLAGIAAVIALALPVWAALFIVALLVFLLALILVLVARSLLKRVRTPAPEASIEEAKQTAQAFRSGLQRMVSRASPRQPAAAGGGTPAATAPGGGAGGSAPTFGVPAGSSQPMQPSVPVQPPEPAPPAPGSAPAPEEGDHA